LRFLVDANLSPQVATRLRSAGLTHVSDEGLLTADDLLILGHASSSG
jgi:predicted nuclease of predicted toxin-antitoxin system